MQDGQPSRTALSAATHRAAHQLIEGGRIFADPLAVPILGREPDEIRADAEAHPERRRMRIFIAVRTRFAHDALRRAVARGVRQLVVLGAGLDTSAYRRVLEPGLRVFEVDHPDTQAWKRERLAAIGVAAPAGLAFVPVDFERQGLAEQLAGAGFDQQATAFVTWLGVVPYLTENAIFATLGYVAGLPGGGEIVFDYGDPPGERSAESRKAYDEHADRVAALGEPWVSHFEAEPLRRRLVDLGFRDVEDLGPREITARYLPGRPMPASDRGGHVIRAASMPP